MDYKQTLHEARMFRLAAALCLNEQEKHLYYPDKKDLFLLAPSVVNYGFAIELFLKTLLIKEGKHSKGHVLYNLFLKLKPKTQNHIQDLVQIPPFVYFDVLLKVHSNIYEDWRYFYQKKGGSSKRVDFHFLMNLGNALDKTIVDFYINKSK